MNISEENFKEIGAEVGRDIVGAELELLQEFDVEELYLDKNSAIWTFKFSSFCIEVFKFSLAL